MNGKSMVLPTESVRRAGSAIGFTLSLVLPSTVVVEKYLGSGGVLVYFVVASLALLSVHRYFFAKLASTITFKKAVGLAIGTVIALAVIFSVGYPIANSGLVGPGSDRDEALNIATTELLEGRYP